MIETVGTALSGLGLVAALVAFCLAIHGHPVQVRRRSREARRRHLAAGHGLVGSAWERQNVRRDIGRGARA